jgi:hypothetical protein
LSKKIKLNIHQSQFCKLNCEDLGIELYGDIFQYVGKDKKGNYILANHLINRRIYLFEDTSFTLMPYHQSIRFLIDLALQTKDEKWFYDLCHQLEYECEDPYQE